MASKHLLFAAACGMLALAVGCDMTHGSRDVRATGVAVIDLDEIARRLGSDKQIAQSVAQRQSTLYQQLVQLAKSYNDQITTRKQTAAKEQTPPERVTLAAFEQEAEAKLTQAKQQAAQNLSAHQAQLVKQFRDQIRPAARRIANERGMSVIVTKNDSVVYDFSQTVDITEAVIAELSTVAATAPETTTR